MNLSIVQCWVSRACSFVKQTRYFIQLYSAEWTLLRLNPGLYPGVLTDTPQILIVDHLALCTNIKPFNPFNPINNTHNDFLNTLR